MLESDKIEANHQARKRLKILKEQPEWIILYAVFQTS